MLTDFILNKLKDAKYKILEDGRYFGEISGVKGVWANTRNLEACRVELHEVLEDWLILQLREGKDIAGFKKSTLKAKSFQYA